MCNKNGTADRLQRIVPATAGATTLVLMAVAVWCGTRPALAAQPRRVVQAWHTDLAEVARGLPIHGSLRVEGVQFEGAATALELERFEAFTKDAQVVIADGHSERVLPVPDNAYYRGAVEGDLAAVAVLTARANGRLRGLIIRNGEPWVISDEPPPAGGRGLSTRKIDLATEFGNQPFRCDSAETVNAADTVDAADTVGPDPAPDSQPAAPAADVPTVNYTARIAVETDHEFFQKFGNSDDATAYVGDLFAYASTIYESEVNTSLVVSYLRLWTTSADPWTETSCGSALTEFQNYWTLNNTGVSRTTAHMLSGKSTGCGIAYVGALCGSNGYGLSGSLNGKFDSANPGVVWDILAVTHEIGHNFNSPHSHCYNGIGGSSEPVDQCYSGESGCYSGTRRLPCSAGAGHGCGTIMSYCHLLSGGYGNITMTFGTGFQYGVLPDRIPTRMHNFVVSRAASFPSCLALIPPTSPPTSTPTIPAATRTPTPTAGPIGVTTLCSATSSTTNNTIACNPTHDTTVNNAVIACVVDNTTGSAPTMADSTNAACTASAQPWPCCTGIATGTCSGGNPYTVNSTVSNTTGTTRITVFSAPIAHQLKTTDTIRATLSNAVQYKSLSVLEVAGLQQSLAAVTVDVTPSGAIGNSASPSLSSGRLADVGELIVACLGVQANTGTTYSGLTTAGGGGWANDGATVVGSAGNASGTVPRQLWPEYKFMPTATSFTAGGPNSLSAAKQWALALVSFKGAPATATPTPANPTNTPNTTPTPTATPIDTPTAGPIVVTTLCSATSSTNNNTIACTPTHDTTANNAVIACVVDNTTASPPTMADSTNAACAASAKPWPCCTGIATGTCSGGNPYTLNSTVSNTAGTTRITVFSAPIAHQLKTTDTIRATLSNTVQYKSLSVLEVSGLQQSLAAVTVDVTPTGAIGNSASPSLSSGTLADIGELIVACLGVQANTGTTYSGLTTGGAGGPANDGATVIGAAGNASGTVPRQLWPEYEVMPTATSFTAGGPNSLSAAKQWALALVSFKRF